LYRTDHCHLETYTFTIGCLCATQNSLGETEGVYVITNHVSLWNVKPLACTSSEAIEQYAYGL